MRGPQGSETHRTRSEVRSVAIPTTFTKQFDESKSYLRKLLEPIDDLLGSADYKLYITGVLLERALQQAVQNAERKQDEKNG